MAIFNTNSSQFTQLIEKRLAIQHLQSQVKLVANTTPNNDNFMRM